MLQTTSGFGFTAKPVADLESQAYTIGNILCDNSGSVSGYKTELEKAISAAAEACLKSPRAEDMLLRVATFNDSLSEIHGFLSLNDIGDPAVADAAQRISQHYNGSIRCGGSTALYDAALESIETVRAYAEKLVANRYSANGICFIITDGGENASRTASIQKIKDALHKVRTDEKLESLKVVLVGVGSGMDQYFQDFANQCGFDQYINIGDATPAKLARLAAFISKSISSSSQALGTGGQSQNIVF